MTNGLLFDGELFTVGEFHAVPGDGLWGREMRIGDRSSLVVFPGTAVRITQPGIDSVVANPTNVIFYDPGRLHRRDPVDPRGDHCVFVGLAPARLAEVAAMTEPSFADHGDAFHFPHTFGPAHPAAFLLERHLERYLRAGPAVDALVVEETLCRIVEQTVGDAIALRAEPRSTARPTTDRARAELSEAAAAVLSMTFREPRTLTQVARDVLTSPFHLARIFRARTGWSLHGYRTQLRLRSALERLTEPHVELADVALEAGFSSHSHFTDTFRGAFGVPPSHVRRLWRAADLREMRTILEVRLRATS